jgi:hypothetical protein
VAGSARAALVHSVIPPTIGVLDVAAEVVDEADVLVDEAGVLVDEAGLLDAADVAD